MGIGQIITDKNYCMKVYNLAIDNFDKFVQEYGHHFAENIRANYFDSRVGGYVELIGRDHYFEFIKNTGQIYGFKIDEVLISEDHDRIFMFYHQITTEKSPYYDKNLPPVEVLSIQYIENNQIVRVKNMFDTFQVLLHVGKVVMKSQDKEQINQYLKNLINIGLITSDHLN